MSRGSVWIYVIVTTDKEELFVLVHRRSESVGHPRTVAAPGGMIDKNDEKCGGADVRRCCSRGGVPGALGGVWPGVEPGRSGEDAGLQWEVEPLDLRDSSWPTSRHPRTAEEELEGGGLPGLQGHDGCCSSWRRLPRVGGDHHPSLAARPSWTLPCGADARSRCQEALRSGNAEGRS